MKKRILLITLILAIAFGIAGVSALAAFEAQDGLQLLSGQQIPSDKPSTWAEDEVFAAIAIGLVPRSLQSAYLKETTRAEFCALAVALYENYTGGEIAGRITFTDTKDINVEKAAAIGVVDGYGNGIFAPDDLLTREQAATMLARIADAIGKTIPEVPATFADSAKLSSWAVKAVGQVQAAGIMGGIGNNTFAPKGPYTREQSIATMLRLFLVKIVIVDEPENLKPPTEVPSTEAAPDEKAVYESMIALKAEYPEGMPWTNDNSYTSQIGNTHYIGYGCHAFALILSDAAFGKLPIREHNDFNDIRVGDMLRVDYNTHTVIVLGVSGDEITIAEGNYNSSIHWGRKLTKNYLVTTGSYVITRYP